MGFALNIGLLAGAMFLLIKSAGWLVTGASLLAKRYRIPDFIIGLTIVAFGTSLPELMVNLFSSITGNTEIAIGNILGSNVANVLLILGTTVIIFPIRARNSIIISEIPFSLIAALLVGFLANTHVLSKSPDLLLDRGDGLILLFFFALYFGYIIFQTKLNPQDAEELEIGEQPQKWKYWLIPIGVVGMSLGGKFVVDSAVNISSALGLSESFIGLTVVAIGTSLPELVTSVIAAKRQNADMAIGNVVGSNIFNILWILGLSSVIRPLPFKVASNFDILMIVGTSALLILVTITGKGFKIRRWAGALFLLLYVGYIAYLVVRG